MPVLDCYIAFDLETTGINPDTCEIIEFGAVRVEEGEITDRFQSLVRPRKAPSPQIQRITGITEDELASGSPIATVLPKFYKFIGTTPLFAHNASFDAGFLHAVDPNRKLPPVYDTLELARVALPRLRNHRLGTLLDAFGIPIGNAHRALDDAEGLARLVLLLADTLGGRQFTHLEALASLASAIPEESTAYSREKDLTEPVSSLIMEVIERTVRRGMGASIPHVDEKYLTSLPNTIGEFDAFSNGEARPVEPLPLLDEEVQHVFSADGPLADEMPGYEPRDTQTEMAGAVTQAFNDAELLVCEAGTGTGKSIAYLVPAILWALKNGRRVVVSTNTKNLQEQLFYKDLPLLARVLKTPFRAALLKGKGNYICMKRWRSGDYPGAGITSDRDRSFSLPIATWVTETASGDISENSGFQSVGPGKGLWAKLSAEGQPCTPGACRFYNDCFVTRIRRASQAAHVVVVNHSLLFSDLISDNAVLREYEDLIIDEAHNIEKTAGHFLGAELSQWTVRDVATRLYLQEGAESGLLSRINRELSKSALSQDKVKTFQMQVARAIDTVNDLSKASSAFFDRLDDVLDAGNQKSKFAAKISYKSGDGTFEPALAERDLLIASVEAVREEVNTLQNWIRDLDTGRLPSQEEFVTDLENRSGELGMLMETVADLTEAGDDAYVYWYEKPAPAVSRGTGIKLQSAPLRVGNLLQDSLFAPKRTVVMTSATLAVANKFNYFLSRSGLTGNQGERVRTLAVGSPFDYDRQAFVAVPTWFPSPKDRSFQKAVTELVKELVLRTRRGTLVLFTSYSMLNTTYRSVSEDFAGEGILLLGQGRDGSRTSIADLFRNEKDSVLFGTESFWEGVDVPGDALETLIIVKLPFAVPTEPLVVAQSELLRQQGKDPFLYMSVPETAIKFRQGFGRLIRGKKDRGAVIILDTRVVTERFGRAFLKSLPTEHKAFKTLDNMVAALDEWFGSTDAVQRED